MRSLFIYFILFISCNCNEIADSKSVIIERIEKKRMVFSDYLIINQFPKINKGQFNDSSLQKINKYFENVNELNLLNDPLAFNFKDSNKEIIGDYIILSENDNIVTFEFFVKKGDNIVNYKPVFFDKNNVKLKDCEDVIKNISRKKLRKYIEDYSKTSNVKINLNAYEEGSNTKLTFAIQDEALYIYAGKEGEFGGKYKIEVPLNCVLK